MNQSTTHHNHPHGVVGRLAFVCMRKNGGAMTCFNHPCPPRFHCDNHASGRLAVDLVRSDTSRHNRGFLNANMYRHNWHHKHCQHIMEPIPRLDLAHCRWHMPARELHNGSHIPYCVPSHVAQQPAQAARYVQRPTGPQSRPTGSMSPTAVLRLDGCDQYIGDIGEQQGP